MGSLGQQQQHSFWPSGQPGGFSCLDIQSKIPCNQAAGSSALRGFSAVWQVSIWLQSGFMQVWVLMAFSNFNMSWFLETDHSHSCAFLHRAHGVDTSCVHSNTFYEICVVSLTSFTRDGGSFSIIYLFCTASVCLCVYCCLSSLMQWLFILTVFNA